MRALLKRINRLAQERLSPETYLRVAMLAYPIVDRARRGSGLRVEPWQNGAYRARLADMDFYFDQAIKVHRYLFPRGPGDIFRQMEEKYSGTGVRIEQGDIVMDVGANVGEFTVQAARTAKLVLALEPEPAAFACLSKNLEQLSHVICSKDAVGDEDRTAKFYSSPARNDSSFIKPSEAWSETTVAMKTIPTIMAEHGLSHIDFLKIDAEGYEPEVLSGASPVLHRIAKVAADVSPERMGESTADACRAILEEHGFATEDKAGKGYLMLLAWRC
jgi:FkbM family methyltransferase